MTSELLVLEETELPLEKYYLQVTENPSRVSRLDSRAQTYASGDCE